MWKFLERAALMDENDATAKKILTHQFTKELYLNYVKVSIQCGHTDKINKKSIIPQILNRYNSFS